MQFKEYFFRDKAVWKLLTDGSEIVVPGDTIAALIDTATDAILAHGPLHQVVSAEAAYRRANPHFAPERIRRVSRSLAGVTAQFCERLNHAIEDGDGKALVRVLATPRSRSAA